MKRHGITLLTVILIIFEHFELGALANYPVTIGLLVGILLLSVTSDRLALTRTTVSLSIICIPNILVQVVAPSLRDGYWSFFATLALFALGGVIVAQYNAGTVKRKYVDSIAHGIFIALIVVTVLTVLQVATGSRGNLSFFNLFGEHQYLYQYNANVEFSPLPRAAAFYLEPSYAAFVAGSLAIALVASRRHVISAWMLGSVALLAVRSATGLVVFVAAAIVALLVSRSRWRFPSTIGLLILATIAVPYLTGRFDSTFTTGSSAYYRLIGPLQVLRDTLNRYPLGHPFGSLSTTVADYGILNGVSAGDSLDNGFYVLIFYFGWLGVVASAALLVWALREVVRAHRSRRPGRAVVAVWSVGSLFFSGGIMLPEYLLTLWLLFAIQPVDEPSATLRDGQVREDSALDSHSHLQRR